MLFYNNKEDNRNERQVPISVMLDSNLPETNSEYNISHTHFSHMLTVFVYILETWNKIFWLQCWYTLRFSINFSRHLILKAQFFDFVICQLFTFYGIFNFQKNGIWIKFYITLSQSLLNSFQNDLLFFLILS